MTRFAAHEPARRSPGPALGPVERELQVIAARVRLALYQHIAWTESRDPATAWTDAWRDRDARRRWADADARGRELAGARAEVEAAVDGETPRLRLLGQIFGLDARELDVVSAGLATAVEPELAGAFAAACGRPVPTEALLSAVFDHGVRRVLTPDSPLVRWALIQRVEMAPGEPDGIALDPGIVDWFTGAYAVEAALVELARPVAAPTPLASWPVDSLVDWIEARWSGSGERGRNADAIRVVVTGPAGAGRRSFAAAVAARLGLSLTAIEVGAVGEEDWRDVVCRAHRQAFLTQTAIAFVDPPGSSAGSMGAFGGAGGGAEGSSGGLGAGPRPWPRLGAVFPLGFLCVESGIYVAPAADAIDVVVDLPPPTAADREALWRALVPAAADWGEGLTALARRTRCSPADIHHAARRAVATPDEAAAVVRERTRDRLGDLARRLECPFSWDDLVLSAPLLAVLRDLEYEGRVRDTLWEADSLRRMFPQGRGLFALFVGPSGTGKTMAAQVIARELGVSLYRISLATVVSKYVGETAKNLQRILSRAEHLDAVLLFDEADALFGKRTEIKDAHDRYANTDTNHLLQAIESYAGMAILSSNQRGNIDPAFTRRLRYVVAFPRPDAEQRRRLWGRVAGAMFGADAQSRLGGALDALSSAIEVTGAQIKYAALSAVLAAHRDGAPIAVDHVLWGVARELDKDGRSLTERERELVRNAA